MPLLTPAQLKAQVQTPLRAEQLQEIIDGEEAELITRFGPHYDGTALTETVGSKRGVANVYTRRKIASVSSVQERDAGGSLATVSSTAYEVWAGQGRIERVSGAWKAVVAITYIPIDDTAKRRQGLIDLIRIVLERTAMRAESVAGEYSYTAGDWDVDRAKIFRRLGFMEIAP